VLNDGKLTYTVMEVAELLGICRGTAYEQVKQGVIPSLQVGKRILVPKRQLEIFLEGECQTLKRDCN